ncbi:MAG: hypothetical protein ACJ8AO_20500 [Gemmatimonadaceae bacterium]
MASLADPPMPLSSRWRAARASLAAAALGIAAARTAAGQGPTPAGEPRPAVAGCPAGYERNGAPSAKTAALRQAQGCRRTVVAWAVTSCPDSAFATYRVRGGADACLPTEVAGVGAPPGRGGTRAVHCPLPAYALVHDRTGLRDRCEQAQVQYAPARP